MKITGGDHGGCPAWVAESAQKIERRRVATGANHPASHSSALRRGPGTPARCPGGGPEHRESCYTEPPPCASRPDYEPISSDDRTSPVTGAPLRPVLRYPDQALCRDT